MKSIIHHPDEYYKILLRSGRQVDALFMLYPTQAHPIDSSTNYLTKDLNDLYPVPHHTVAAYLNRRQVKQNSIEEHCAVEAA